MNDMSTSLGFRRDNRPIGFYGGGFTLAELLIALAILGVIATFAIPKVLQSQQSSERNAIAKEAAAMISGAFSAYQLKNSITTDTGPPDLTPFMNYAGIYDTGKIDHIAGTGPSANGCDTDPTITCLRLHSGAILGYSNTCTIGACTVLTFALDADGKHTGGNDSVMFVQAANGQLTSGGLDPDMSGLGFEDPAWFSWDN